MKEIDISTIRVVDSFGYNKSGSIYYRNIFNLKQEEDVRVYVVLQGKFTCGEFFKKEIKTSYQSFKQLFDITCENIKRDLDARPKKLNLK